MEEMLCSSVSACVCLYIGVGERRAFMCFCTELMYPFGYVATNRNKDN